MKRVEAWTTTDGELFRTEDEASEHQDKLDFEEWYKSSFNNQLFDWENYVECHKVVKYILDNRTAVLKLLGKA